MTDRTIRVVELLEIRYAPTADGPWSEPEVIYRGGYQGGNPSRREWSAPVDAIAEHAAYKRDFGALPERRWEQTRCSAYVPASELERYKAVVETVRKQLEWDHRIGTDELRDVMAAQSFLDASGVRK